MSTDPDHSDYLTGHPGLSSFERAVVRALGVGASIFWAVPLVIVALVGVAVAALCIEFLQWSIGV